MNWLEPEATTFEEEMTFYLYILICLDFEIRKQCFAKICCDQELRPDYSFGKAIWEPALKEATSMQTLDHQVLE